MIKDMKRITLQFHMLPYEILRCLDEYPFRNKLEIKALGSVGRFEVIEFNKEKVLEKTKYETFFLAVGSSKINSGYKSQSDFMKNNPGLLYIDIGYIKNDSLKESGITGFIFEEEKELSGLVSFFKKRLKKGCYAVNPETGESVKIASHYYSDDALLFEENGGKLLALAGSNIYSVSKK